MNYLLDRKTKRNKIFGGFLIAIFLFIFIYFSSTVFSGLSFVSHSFFRPVFILGNSIGEQFGGLSSMFYFKRSLLKENENLKNQLNETVNKMSNYNYLFDENIKMKEILGRKIAQDEFILASILSGSNQSAYDTLIVDVGENHGVSVGDLVFAKGNLAIGKVREVYSNSSKVVLFSTPGEKTGVLISLETNATGNAGRDIFMELVGRGGGNFEMILLRDFNLEKGVEIVLPGITPYVVGLVETIISDPRDSFQKALIVSPINIREIKFVQIKNQ